MRNSRDIPDRSWYGSKRSCSARSAAFLIVRTPSRGNLGPLSADGWGEARRIPTFWRYYLICR